MLKILKILSITIPLIVLLSISFERLGLLDKWLKLDLIEDVAKRFETSYVQADRIVKDDEEAWKPLIKLITRYTNATLPKDKTPKVFARLVAIDSSVIKNESGIIAEWTAPTTPIILIYVDWPGQTVPREDYRIVGTIADLRIWIQQYREYWKFILNDLLITLLAVFLSLTMLHYESNANK